MKFTSVVGANGRENVNCVTVPTENQYLQWQRFYCENNALQ